MGKSREEASRGKRSHRHKHSSHKHKKKHHHRKKHKRRDKSEETVLPITFDEQALQSALESLDATAFPTEVDGEVLGNQLLKQLEGQALTKSEDSDSSGSTVDDSARSPPSQPAPPSHPSPPSRPSPDSQPAHVEPAAGTSDCSDTATRSTTEYTELRDGATAPNSSRVAVKPFHRNPCVKTITINIQKKSFEQVQDRSDKQDGCVSSVVASSESVSAKFIDSKVTYMNLKKSEVNVSHSHSASGDVKKERANRSYRTKDRSDSLSSRDRSRSRSHSHSTSRPSHSRSRKSNSRSRWSHSRSRKSHSRSRRSHSRSRKSHSRARRSRSRSKNCSHIERSYSRSRRRSRSRDHHHHHRSRSPRRHHSAARCDRTRHRQSRSPLRRHRDRYSRSRSRSPRRGRRRSRSSGRSQNMSPSTSCEKVPSAGVALLGSKIGVITHFTNMCKELQDKQAVEEGLTAEERVELEARRLTQETEYRAPFEINESKYKRGLVFHNSSWKTPNQIVSESSVLIECKPLEEKFPVSTGIVHQRHDREDVGRSSKTTETSNIFARNHQPVSVSDLVKRRMEASQKLQVNPADPEAKGTLHSIDQQTKVWAESKMKPGQFTGDQKITALSRDDHKVGIQAWAKKKMFHGLKPVMGGFGMRMLCKMGWEMGQPLGRSGEGHTEPITLDVKLDRIGLTTVADKKPGLVPAAALQAKDAKTANLIQGKHPVSVLQEVGAKKKWGNPRYELMDCSGPAHKMGFLYRVTTPIGSFQPAVASASKKLAKSQAAHAALQGLGLVETTFGYSAS